jgi:hypothetical protein
MKDMLVMSRMDAELAFEIYTRMGKFDMDKAKYHRILVLRAEKEKKRTITYLHDLWKRALVRFKQRQDMISECITRITSTIQPDSDGRYHTYYKRDGVLRKYVIKWDNRYQSYTYTEDSVNMNTREGKISDIAADLILGNEFRFLNTRMVTYKHQFVFSKMWNKVEKNLRDNHKIEEFYYDKIITVKIAGIDYLVHADKSQCYYTTYKWIGEDNGEIFTME